MIVGLPISFIYMKPLIFILFLRRKTDRYGIFQEPFGQ